MSDQPKIFFVVFLFLLGSFGIIVWYFVTNAENITFILNLPTWLIYAASFPLFLLPLFLGFKIFKKFKSGLEIDGIRKKDLEDLKHGFRLFFQDHGYFPASNMGKEYSEKGVRIPNGWNLYQYPNHEIMWKYIRKWPINDPSFDVKKPKESRYYLYKVRDEGKHFSVYAQLDNTNDKDSKNYNEIDKINPILGSYNYKIGY